MCFPSISAIPVTKAWIQTLDSLVMRGFPILLLVCVLRYAVTGCNWKSKHLNKQLNAPHVHVAIQLLAYIHVYTYTLTTQVTSAILLFALLTEMS